MAGCGGRSSGREGLKTTNHLYQALPRHLSQQGGCSHSAVLTYPCMLDHGASLLGWLLSSWDFPHRQDGRVFRSDSCQENPSFLIQEVPKAIPPFSENLPSPRQATF